MSGEIAHSNPEGLLDAMLGAIGPSPAREALDLPDFVFDDAQVKNALTAARNAHFAESPQQSPDSTKHGKNSDELWASSVSSTV